MLNLASTAPGLIPESGKPKDLDVELITNQGQAEIVLRWLDVVIDDMQMQILGHLMASHAPQETEWLSKIRGALRGTIRSRAEVAEKRLAYMLSADNRD